MTRRRPRPPGADQSRNGSRVRLGLGHIMPRAIGGVDPHAHQPAGGWVTKHLVGPAPVLLGPPALPVAPSPRGERRRSAERARDRASPHVGVGRRGARPPARLPPRGPSVPALRRRDPVSRSGRRQPHGVLVSRVPERRRPARTVVGARDASCAPTLRRAPPLLSRRLPPARGGGRRGSADSLRLRGARRAGPPFLLRVPPARSRLRRGARFAACERRGCRDRGGGARTRAGRRDLRARTRGTRFRPGRRGRRPVPERRRSAPRRDG